MPPARRRGPSSGRHALRAGILTGLVSSTFSSLFVQLGARQIGRDPNVDWMVVGTVPLRSHAMLRRPTPTSTAAGIFSHQLADLLWATVFFRLVLHRVRPGRRKAVIAASAVPWAALTAAAEYSVFLPWVQPVLRMQVPYWTAFGVHTSSAAAYPLFLWASGDDRRAGRRTAAALAAALVALGALEALDRRRRLPRVGPAGQRREADLRFMFRMAGHHEAGLDLSRLAAERAHHPDLQALGRLMVAQHEAELALLRRWWEAWEGSQLPALSDEDRAEMSGMPTPAEVAALGHLEGHDFDLGFVRLMVPHHFGAIRMSREVIRHGGDPRVRALAAAIAHSQQRQAALMEARWPPTGERSHDPLRAAASA